MCGYQSGQPSLLEARISAARCNSTLSTHLAFCLLLHFTNSREIRTVSSGRPPKAGCLQVSTGRQECPWLNSSTSTELACAFCALWCFWRFGARRSRRPTTILSSAAQTCAGLGSMPACLGGYVWIITGVCFRLLHGQPPAVPVPVASHNFTFWFLTQIVLQSLGGLCVCALRALVLVLSAVIVMP